MNTREYYAQAFKAEKPKFVRVLQAVPGDKSSYRPHERSTSAGDLVKLQANEQNDACEKLDNGQVEHVPKPAPSVSDAVAAYERNAAELEKRLDRIDDAAWEKNAKFLMNGAVVWEAPLGDMLYGFLFDAIHHRGQLSTYLRPMGAKVPAIYGPSADDPGM